MNEQPAYGANLHLVVYFNAPPPSPLCQSYWLSHDQHNPHFTAVFTSFHLAHFALCRTERPWQTDESGNPERHPEHPEDAGQGHRGLEPLR